MNFNKCDIKLFILTTIFYLYFIFHSTSVCNYPRAPRTALTHRTCILYEFLTPFFLLCGTHKPLVGEATCEENTKCFTYTHFVRCVHNSVGVFQVNIFMREK